MGLNLAMETKKAKLALKIQGQEIVLSREPAWRNLQGAAADRNLINAFANFRKRERESEDSRP